MKYETNSEEETIALGRELAREYAGGGVVLLKGNLGAGKTALAKGILEGLGVATVNEVTSPTFTLIHEYGGGGSGKARAYHIDLYRLETAREVAGLGLDELMGHGSLMLVEWGERFPQMWPEQRVEIDIETSRDEAGLDVDTRHIHVTELGVTPDGSL